MSRMAHDFFTQSPLLALPIIAMLLFCFVFLTIVVRAMRTSETEIAANSSLPLEEDRHD